MKAAIFHGGDICLDDVKGPQIKEKNDAIVVLTASAICGTDLHMIRKTLSGMETSKLEGRFTLSPRNEMPEPRSEQ